MKTAASPRAHHDDFTPQWAVFFLMLAVLGAGGWLTMRYQAARAPLPPPSASATAYHVDWFLVLRMPEVFDHKTQTDIAQKRMVQWLEALREAGFQPIRLSEAQARLRQGKGLPEKSVAIAFDPGYRHTYEAMAPILARLQWPAAWFSPRSSLWEGDTHYVSLHRAREMERSGWWDVILYKESDPPWAAGNGTSALNRENEETRLHRLNVNAMWTKQELISRLLAERPLQEASYLTLQEIQSQQWGTVVPVGSSVEKTAFRFQAPPDKRGAWLSWPGTRGIHDLSLKIQVSSLTGELWLILRSDSKSGQGIRIALANGRIVVEEERDRKRYPLGSAVVPALRQPGSFTADIQLFGTRLDIVINGTSRLALPSLTPPASNEGVIRLAIYDKITGAAHVDSVKILAAPIL